MTVILLTGYRGFIGGALLELLLTKPNYKVIVVGSPTDRYENLPSNVDYLTIKEIYGGNLTTQGVDVIVNCANSYENTLMTNQSPLTVNLQFPLFILETLLDSAKHFINLDTSLNKRGEPYLARPFYSLSKKHFKEYLEMIEGKIKVSNIMCEHVYGYGSMTRSTLISDLIRSGMQRDHHDLKMTSGHQVRDFVYVEDVASAILCVIESRLLKFEERFIEFEVGSGQGFSIMQLATLIQKKLQLENPFPLGTAPYRENEIMYSVANLKLIQSLGWKPLVNLAEGLDRVINYSQSSKII